LFFKRLRQGGAALAIAGAFFLVPGSVFGRGLEGGRITPAEYSQNEPARMRIAENVGVIDAAIENLSGAFTEFPPLSCSIELSARPEINHYRHFRTPIIGLKIGAGGKFVFGTKGIRNIIDVSGRFALVFHDDDNVARLPNCSDLHYATCSHHLIPIGIFPLDNSSARNIGPFDLAGVQQLAALDRSEAAIGASNHIGQL
jgi:hypothetical protein